MSVLEYAFSASPETFKPEWFGLSRNKPTWFEKLNPFVSISKMKEGGYKSAKDALKETRKIPFSSEYKPGGTFRSVKTCPGIGNYLSRTIPLKLPSDLIIETKTDNWRFFSPFKASIDVSDHKYNQIQKESFKDYHILKIGFPLLLKSKDKDLRGFFTDPMYYNNDIFWRCVPGVLDFSVVQQINVIILLPKINEHYSFQTGTVCGAITFTKPITKIKQNQKLVSQFDNLIASNFRSTWFRSSYEKY